MKFKIRCKHTDNSDNTPWWEHYDKAELHTVAQCEQWAKNTIEQFNATLRPGERPRQLLRVWVFGQSDTHLWEKISLVTEPGGFDRMQCKKCGITGKRFGLGGNGVVIDKEFDFKKYRKCKGHPWPNTLLLM